MIPKWFVLSRQSYGDDTQLLSYNRFRWPLNRRYSHRWRNEWEKKGQEVQDCCWFQGCSVSLPVTLRKRATPHQKKYIVPRVVVKSGERWKENKVWLDVLGYWHRRRTVGRWRGRGKPRRGKSGCKALFQLDIGWIWQQVVVVDKQKLIRRYVFHVVLDLWMVGLKISPTMWQK